MFLTIIPGILGCSVKFQDSIEVDGPCFQTIFPFLVTMIKHMKVAEPIIFRKIVIMSKMGKMDIKEGGDVKQRRHIMKDLPCSGRPPQWNTASLPESESYWFEFH